MRADMVRAYVETLLEKLTGADKVLTDHDGDYPVRYRSALYYVRLVGEIDPVVQVFAIAVNDIEPSAGLYERLNEINADIGFARTFWVRGQVLVESDLAGRTVNPEDFDKACHTVATITDRIGPLIAEEFGGHTAFADGKDEDGPDDEPVRVGHYL